MSKNRFTQMESYDFGITSLISQKKLYFDHDGTGSVEIFYPKPTGM